MIINHNLSAVNANRNLGVNDSQMNKSLEKLSSGYRINRAADDAAGLAISEKMRGQVNGLNQAVRNAQDGISMIQTAEGALNETHAILQRMRELAVQAGNDTNTDNDRAQIQSEVVQLQSEIGRIATTTQFNTKSLLTGTMTGAGGVFQIGANTNQTIKLVIDKADATTLGVAAGTISMSSQTKAELALTAIDNALSLVSKSRANLGAVQNRLEHTIANLNVASENLTAAESRVRDVDMATEMSSFTKQQILQQAGTAMLAQANQKPQSVLKLLG